MRNNCYLIKLRKFIQNPSAYVVEEDGTINLNAIIVQEVPPVHKLIKFGARGPFEADISGNGVTIQGIITGPDINESVQSYTDTTYTVIGDTGSSESGIILNVPDNSIMSVPITIKSGLENLTYISFTDIDLDDIEGSVEHIVFTYSSLGPKHPGIDLQNLNLEYKSKLKELNIAITDSSGDISQLMKLPNKILLERIYVNGNNRISGDISDLSSFTGLTELNLSYTSIGGTIESFVLGQIYNGRLFGDIFISSLDSNSNTSITFNGVPVKNINTSPKRLIWKIEGNYVRINITDNTSQKNVLSSLRIDKLLDENSYIDVFNLNIIDNIINEAVESKIYNIEQTSSQLNKWPFTSIHPIVLPLEIVTSVVINSASCETQDDNLKIKSGTFYNSPYLIYNLVPDTYYEYVGTYIDPTDNIEKTLRRSFKTLGKVRLINIDGVSNVRDIGGWTTKDGKKVKYQIIYRGGHLDSITNNGELQFSNLDINTIVNVGESNVVKDTELVNDYINYNLGNVTNTNNLNEDYYKLIFTNLDSNYRNGIKNIFTKIFNSVQNNSIYIHCNLGKDRTGIVTMLILGLLGVSESDILKEYDLSYIYKPNDIFANSKTNFSCATDFIEGLKTLENTDDFQEAVESYLIDLGIDNIDIDNFKNTMTYIP